MQRNYTKPPSETQENMGINAKMKKPLNRRMVQRLFLNKEHSLMVGVTGLEPAASCTPCRRSGQLSYTPE